MWWIGTALAWKASGLLTVLADPVIPLTPSTPFVVELIAPRRPLGWRSWMASSQRSSFVKHPQGWIRCGPEVLGPDGLALAFSANRIPAHRAAFLAFTNPLSTPQRLIIEGRVIGEVPSLGAVTVKGVVPGEYEIQWQGERLVSEKKTSVCY